MKKFTDLVFTQHSISEGAEGFFDERYGPLKQSTLEFENGYAVSVIFGRLFYSNGKDTYEVWTSGSKIPTGDEWNDPMGYRTPYEVETYMNALERLDA